MAVAHTETCRFDGNEAENAVNACRTCGRGKARSEKRGVMETRLVNVLVCAPEMGNSAEMEGESWRRRAGCGDRASNNL